MMTRFLPISHGHRDEWRAMVLDYDPNIPDPDIGWRKFFGTTKTHFGFFAVRDEDIAGFIHYQLQSITFVEEPVCYIADLYVKPEFRRLGVATDLINGLLLKAMSSDWARVYWVTENDNPARALYDRLAKQDFVRYHVDFKEFV